MSSGIVFAALLAGHWVGDHWAQTDQQATGKGAHGWAGRKACAGHVATLTLCQMAALALVATVEGGFGALPLALGLAVNTASHYWIDRRHTLQDLAVVLGKAGYYDRGGAPHLDQAAHMAFLLPAALIITAPTTAAALILAGVSVAVLFGLDLLARRGRTSSRQRDGIYVVLRTD